MNTFYTIIGIFAVALIVVGGLYAIFTMVLL